MKVIKKKHGNILKLHNLLQELATIELVWQLTDEWDTAWDKYKSGEFWSIQTDEMEEKAQGLFRKLTRLSRELKEKGYTDIIFVYLSKSLFFV